MVIHGANSEHPDLYIYCMLAAYALADMLSDVDDSRVLFSSHRDDVDPFSQGRVE